MGRWNLPMLFKGKIHGPSPGVVGFIKLPEG
jgi:hypothetical protein